jgi:hypothetical protein
LPPPPRLSARFKRGRANQPDPAFPQSPGIILETNSFNLLIATARFVLSKNCVNHNSNRETDNELICTACSPNRAGGKHVNRIKPLVKSTILSFLAVELFTTFSSQNGCGEQVLFVTLFKNPARQEIFRGTIF